MDKVDTVDHRLTPNVNLDWEELEGIETKDIISNYYDYQQCR